MNLQASGKNAVGVLTLYNLYASFSAHSINHSLINASIIVIILMPFLVVRGEVDARNSRHHAHSS